VQIVVEVQYIRCVVTLCDYCRCVYKICSVHAKRCCASLLLCLYLCHFLPSNSSSNSNYLHFNLTAKVIYDYEVAVTSELLQLLLRLILCIVADSFASVHWI
jgi:hypothetical protein